MSFFGVPMVGAPLWGQPAPQNTTAAAANIAAATVLAGQRAEVAPAENACINLCRLPLKGYPHFSLLPGKLV